MPLGHPSCVAPRCLESGKCGVDTINHGFPCVPIDGRATGGYNEVFIGPPRWYVFSDCSEHPRPCNRLTAQGLASCPTASTTSAEQFRARQVIAFSARYLEIAQLSAMTRTIISAPCMLMRLPTLAPHYPCSDYCDGNGMCKDHEWIPGSSPDGICAISVCDPLTGSAWACHSVFLPVG